MTLKHTHRSHAKWPSVVEGLLDPDNVSTDDHYSEAEAETICTMLERNGFKGDKKIFPIRTWVTLILEKTL